MIRRYLQADIESALRDTPVVLVQGARQVGKSTLVQAISSETSGSRPYITLDDATSLSDARSDPDSFLRRFDGPVAIDEVQRAPELFLAMKRVVDRDRRSGRYLLTGSANVHLLPRIAESLAGRMEIVTLSPLTQREIDARSGSSIDVLFEPTPARLVATTNSLIEVGEWVARMLSGGFPEARERSDERRRAWFGSYISTLLQRDVRDFMSIDAITEMPRLLSLLAARVAGLMNISEIGRALTLPHTTLSRYLALLEALFMVAPLSAWSTNAGKRVVKSRKLFLVDTGLVSYLRECDATRLMKDGLLRGALLENFVVNELRAQATFGAIRPTLHHFRTPQGREVDIVIERRSGEVVGVEVKSAASVTKTDFEGLRTLQSIAGERFVRGIVLYDGSEIVQFADQLHAVPIGWLWHS